MSSHCNSLGSNWSKLFTANLVCVGSCHGLKVNNAILDVGHLLTRRNKEGALPDEFGLHRARFLDEAGGEALKLKSAWCGQHGLQRVREEWCSRRQLARGRRVPGGPAEDPINNDCRLHDCLVGPKGEGELPLAAFPSANSVHRVRTGPETYYFDVTVLNQPAARAVQMIPEVPFPLSRRVFAIDTAQYIK
jgi:hypothetical protein